ncbi:MAG TPA: hypothetical protein VIS07_15515 [Candidatus Binatia bacterium]
MLDHGDHGASPALRCDADRGRELREDDLAIVPVARVTSTVGQQPDDHRGALALALPQLAGDEQRAVGGARHRARLRLARTAGRDGGDAVLAEGEIQVARRGVRGTCGKEDDRGEREQRRKSETGPRRHVIVSWSLEAGLSGRERSKERSPPRLRRFCSACEREHRTGVVASRSRQHFSSRQKERGRPRRVPHGAVCVVTRAVAAHAATRQTRAESRLPRRHRAV